MNMLVGPLTTFFEFVHNGVKTVFATPDMSYGITIIVFTAIIRLLLLPLSIKQIKSTNKMSEIQPELKKIQQKYKNDPQKGQQEMTKLYQENGVNPLGGCLPVLIQMPILFALFTLFRNLQGIEGVGFALLPWLDNLAAPDRLFILPIMSAIATFVSMKIGQPASGETNKNMNTMNIAMTGMILFTAIKMNAALVLYWTFNNLFQLVQTLVMKKSTKVKKA